METTTNTQTLTAIEYPAGAAIEDAFLDLIDPATGESVGFVTLPEDECLSDEDVARLVGATHTVLDVERHDQDPSGMAVWTVTIAQ